MTISHTRKALVSLGMSTVLAFTPFTTTVANAVTNDAIESTSAELESARARLNELSAQVETKFADLEDKQAQLASTEQMITDTQQEIEVKQQELGEARSVLSQTMSNNYKHHINFLSFLFGSNSFDDLVSRVYYADKLAEHQSDEIEAVLTIQAELDEKNATLQSEQEKQVVLVEEASSAAAEAQQATQEQANYVNGLDEQLRAEIQAQEEAERQAAEEQARKEAEERARLEAEAAAAQQQNNGGGQTNTQNTNNGDDEEESSPQNSSNSYTPSTPTRHVTDLGSGVGAAIEYAKSQVGVSYSWGGNAIAYQEFDCSGLVWWAFNQAGISIPRGQRMSNGYNSSMIGWVLSNGGWTTSQANLQAGDLMFWGSSVESTSHVGLCIGNGQMIHSNWNGVEITSVYYSSGSFVGGGPIA